MAQEKILNYDILKYYDEKLKAHMYEKDAEVLQSAMDYADGLADNYDAAGTAQTKIDALADIAKTGSWNDLKDKPFGEIESDTVLTSASSTSKNTFAPIEDPKYYNSEDYFNNNINIIKFNGVEYDVSTLTFGVTEGTGMSYRGNGWILDGTYENFIFDHPADTGEPFVIVLENGGFDIYTKEPNFTMEFIKRGSVSKQLDDKYISDNIARVTYVDAAVAGVQDEVDSLEERVGVIEGEVGDLETLETTAKNDLVNAINEVRSAVNAGGVAAAITIDTTTTTDGALKSYTIKQGDSTIGTIDIPKDMVVKSGEVVTNPEGQTAGTYIKLELANVAEPLYVNVGTLVDIYKAKEDAAQVQVAIDSSTREISAVIVAESIGTTELADAAVTTAKIADGNVTKAKLSTAVQASLDKADASATKAEFDEEVDRAKEAEAKALTDAKAYTDQQVGIEKARAEGIEGGLNTRLAAVEGLLGGEGDDTVDARIEAAKNAAIDAAAADASAKADAAQAAAEATAKKYTDDEIDKVELVDAGQNDRLDALEAKVGDGFIAITTAEVDSLFETQA